MPTGNENLWIAAILFIVVVIGANVLMLGKARGMRGFKGKNFFNFGNATKPWKKEEDNAQELKRRVQELQSKQKKEE